MYDGSSKDIRIDWDIFLRGDVGCFHWQVVTPQNFDVGCPA